MQHASISRKCFIIILFFLLLVPGRNSGMYSMGIPATYQQASAKSSNSQTLADPYPSIIIDTFAGLASFSMYPDVSRNYFNARSHNAAGNMHAPLPDPAGHKGHDHCHSHTEEDNQLRIRLSRTVRLCMLFLLVFVFI